MTDRLPKGWANTHLAEILTLALGGDWGKDPVEVSLGFQRVRVIRGTDFKSWSEAKATRAADRAIKNASLNRRMLRAGDLVLEVSGGGPDQPVGRTILIDEDALERSDRPLVCSNFFRLLRLRPEVNPTFVNYFLTHAYSKGNFNEYQTQTTNLRNLNVTDFLQGIDVPLAPREEQDRIAAKLVTVLNRLRACQTRLRQIPVILKHFRQAVLAAACSGRLTADWREDATLQDLIPPEAANPDEIVEVEETIDAAERWHWLPLQVLCDPDRSICYGVIKLGVEVPDGVPCLRTSDVKPLRIDTTDVKRIESGISGEYRRTLLRGGEVLVNVRGTLGGVAVVPDSLRGWNISREIAVVPTQGVVPKFIAFWIASLPSQNWLNGVAKGVAYTGINIADLKLLPVALPSLTEQQEIVRRVESLFKLSDRIEARYNRAKTQVEKLTQSILAKAFRGELVEQNPNDEPASVLLKRIRQTEPFVPVRRSKRRAPFKNTTRLPRHEEATV